MRVSIFLVLVLGAVCASTAPAVAEVCDKMNPTWSPADGPVDQSGDILAFFTGIGGAVILAAVVASLFIERLWISASSGLISGFMAYVLFSERWMSDTVYLDAIREGCRAEPYSLIAILSLMCCLSVWRTVNIWRRH